MLDRVFTALADPTRRAIVARLRRHDGLHVGELAEPFDMSLPAVIKHIDVLADAGLLRRERSGRHVRCHLERAPFDEAMTWLERHLGFWTPRLDRLVRHAEAREAKLRRKSK
jgi:DNA-binding transcriptional ArsR family regulator